MAEVNRVWRVHYLRNNHWRKKRPVLDLQKARAQAQDLRREGIVVYIEQE